MKTILFVCAATASALMFGDASAAAYHSATRDTDRAWTAHQELIRPVLPMIENGGRCGAGSASALWDGHGQSLGFECDNSANGS